MIGFNIDTSAPVEYVLPDRKTVCVGIFRPVGPHEVLREGQQFITNQTVDGRLLIPILQTCDYMINGDNHVKVRERGGCPAIWTCFVEIDQSR